MVLSSGNCLDVGGMGYQHPNAYCNGAAFAAVLPPANKISGSKSNVGAILGIAGGVVVGAALLGLLVFLVFRSSRTVESKAIVLYKPEAAKSLPQDTTKTPADASKEINRQTYNTYILETNYILSPENFFFWITYNFTVL